MTRRELLELLTVERHAPGPRPVRTSPHCDPPRELTPEDQARNRQILADAVGADLTVVAWRDAE